MKMFNKLPTNPSISYGAPSDDDVSISFLANFPRMNIQFIGSEVKINTLISTLISQLVKAGAANVSGLDAGNVYLGIMARNFIVRDTSVRYLKLELTSYSGTLAAVCVSQDKEIIDEPSGGIEVDRMEMRCKSSGLPINSSYFSATKISIPCLQLGNRQFSICRVQNETTNNISFIEVSESMTVHECPCTILSNPGRGIYDEITSEFSRLDQSLTNAKNNFVSR